MQRRSLHAAIFQYDLRIPAAKDNSIAHAAAAPSNLDAAITMRSALGRKLQLQNRISTPERKKDDFEAPFKRVFEKKIAGAKMEKIC